ncbi:MAG: hypothetical protein NT166_25865 [Candidatus Aminicenantes bacterium]|nr:hypothetical protein [Candidatus Aminicenantes bacterium]
MQLDPEISAMNETLDALKTLDNGQRKRVVDWITARYRLTEVSKFQTPEEEKQTEAVDIVQPIEIPIVRRRGRKPGPKKAGGDPDEKDIKNYETVLDLFSESSVKKVGPKILLMSAYLQEKLKFEEISSFDINSRLKRIKHGVTNISSAINGLMKKKPQLLTEIEKPGEDGNSSRRKFRVTEEGLKLAKTFLK